MPNLKRSARLQTPHIAFSRSREIKAGFLLAGLPPSTPIEHFDGFTSPAIGRGQRALTFSSAVASFGWKGRRLRKGVVAT